MKKRLLIPITMQFGVRYLLRSGLLEYLLEDTTPVVLLAWEDAELISEIESLGGTVGRLPRERWGRDYSRLRKKIDILHKVRLASPSTAIDNRRNRVDAPFWNRVFLSLLDIWRRVVVSLPGVAEKYLSEEKRLLRSDTNFQEFQQVIDVYTPDLVFSLTPFHRDEEMLLRAAEAAGISMCCAIHSFDNITTRGWISAGFQRYLVWNRYNAAELLRAYPHIRSESVAVVGTPQFDFYWDESYIWPEDEWRRALQLPPGRPVILFGGGPKSIVPHEPHFLKQLDQAIEDGELPGRPIILFRRHPVDPIDRWLPTIRTARHIVCDEPWEGGERLMHFNIRRAHIERLVSTLRHSQVHVNTSSTMTVDGAIFDRPQIGPAYDDRPGGKYDRITRELYIREHYLPITNSGGLHVVRSRDQMVDAVRQGLAQPEAGAGGRRKMVCEICEFTDGQSTGRVASELLEFARSHPAASS